MFHVKHPFPFNVDLKLLRYHHNMSRAAFTFGSGFNPIVIAQSDMDDSTLIRCHRTKFYTAVLTSRAIRRRTGNRFQLLPLTTLVSLYINNNGVSESHFPNGNSRNKELQGIQGLSVTSDQHGKIIAGYIKDKLSFITFVFVDRHFANIEILQDILENGNGCISHLIELLIAQLGDSAFLGRISLVFRNLFLGFHGMFFEFKFAVGFFRHIYAP